MVIFTAKRKDFIFKKKLNGKPIYETDLIKYLDITIDNKLNWKAHIDNIAVKLIRANKILYKVRDYVNIEIIKSIYHALIESHIHYACIIWRQNVCTIHRLFMLQKKEIRLTYLNTQYTSLSFSNQKSPDKIIEIENCLYIIKDVNNKLPPIFNSSLYFSP